LRYPSILRDSFFPGERISGGAFSKEEKVRFDNVEYACGEWFAAEFDGARFIDDVWFRNCSVRGAVSFVGAVFQASSYFLETTFEGIGFPDAEALRHGFRTWNFGVIRAFVVQHLSDMLSLIVRSFKRSAHLHGRHFRATRILNNLLSLVTAILAERSF
jgi:hypothetical protein